MNLSLCLHFYKIKAWQSTMPLSKSDLSTFDLLCDLYVKNFQEAIQIVFESSHNLVTDKEHKSSIFSLPQALQCLKTCFSKIFVPLFGLFILCIFSLNWYVECQTLKGKFLVYFCAERSVSMFSSCSLSVYSKISCSSFLALLFWILIISTQMQLE